MTGHPGQTTQEGRKTQKPPKDNSAYPGLLQVLSGPRHLSLLPATCSQPLVPAFPGQAHGLPKEGHRASTCPGPSLVLQVRRTWQGPEELRVWGMSLPDEGVGAAGQGHRDRAPGSLPCSLAGPPDPPSLCHTGCWTAGQGCPAPTSWVGRSGQGSLGTHGPFLPLPLTPASPPPLRSHTHWDCQRAVGQERRRPRASTFLVRQLCLVRRPHSPRHVPVCRLRPPSLPSSPRVADFRLTCSVLCARPAHARPLCPALGSWDPQETAFRTFLVRGLRNAQW